MAATEPFHSSMPASSRGIDFVTLGMFIIDEIHYLPPRPPVTDILGGAGTYAAIGARLFSPPPLSKTVSWIVDAGSDFPTDLRERIFQWETSILWRETPWRKTTRGWNGYDANEERGFKYLTPKLRLDEESLDDQLLASRSFHLICSPSRCINLINNIKERRQAVFSHTMQDPVWVWEPVPDLCVPSELENCRAALGLVDIVSPNHIELCNFFGKDAHDANGYLDREAVEACCRDWLGFGIGNQGRGAMVVRVGKHGCCLAMAGEELQWIPAYHQDGDKVVDPTGGGNCFLGALSVTLVRIRGDTSNRLAELREAACAGSVAASFAIEQVGLPTLAHHATEEKEHWNGESVSTRLTAFKQRVNGQQLEQHSVHMQEKQR